MSFIDIQLNPAKATYCIFYIRVLNIYQNWTV